MIRSESNGDLVTVATSFSPEIEFAVALDQVGNLEGRAVTPLKSDLSLYERVVDTAIVPFEFAQKTCADIGALPLVGKAAYSAATYLAYRAGSTLAMTYSTQLAWFIMSTAAPVMFIGPLAPMGTLVGSFGPHIAWLMYGIELRNHIENLGGLALAGSFALPGLIHTLRGFLTSTAGSELKIEFTKMLESLTNQGAKESSITHLIEHFNKISEAEQKEFITQWKQDNPE